MRASGASAALGAETRQRLGQQVRAELRGAAAAVGQLGQAERRRFERGHRPDDRRAGRGGERPTSRATIAAGADGSRWVPWSSTPVARRSARRGGFDSHAFPPRRAHVAGSPASPERRAAARRDRGRAPRPTTTRRRSPRRRGTPSTTSAPASAPARPPGRSDDLADCGRRPARRVRRRGRRRTVINATGVIVHTNLGRAPWPRAAIAAAAARGFAVAARVRPRDRPPRRPLPPRRGAPHRPDRGRGRAGHQQQRGGPRPRGRARRAGWRRRLARRARRDRRRRADPGDRPAGRGEADRGRDDEPDARRRLRGAAGGGPGEGGPPRPPVELHDGRVHRGARPGRGRPDRPRATARSSSTTSGRGRCCRPSASGWPTSRCQPSAWRPGRMSSRSAATSWSADRRPGWSSVGRTSSPGCGATRWRGRCARTRRRCSASRRRSACIGRAGPSADIPVWRMIATARRRPAGPGRARWRRRIGDGGHGRRRSRRPSAAAASPARRSRRSGVAIAGSFGDPDARGLCGAARPGRSSAGSRTARVVLDLRTVDPRPTTSSRPRSRPALGARR